MYRYILYRFIHPPSQDYPIQPSAHPSIHPSNLSTNHLPFHTSKIYQATTNTPPVHLFTHPSIHPPFCSATNHPISIYLSNHPPILHHGSIHPQPDRRPMFLGLLFGLQQHNFSKVTNHFVFHDSASVPLITPSGLGGA